MKKAILLKKSKLRLIIFLYSCLFILPTSAAQDNPEALLIAPTVPKSSKYDRLKKTIAVVNFSGASPSIGAFVGNGITDMLITSLVQSGNFIVIEREKLDKVLAEQIIAEKNTPAQNVGQLTDLEGTKYMVVTGFITPKTAVQIGKILNTDILLTGRVINFGFVHSSHKKDYFIVGLEANLISTKTGKTLSVNEVMARSKNEVDIKELEKINFQSEAFIKTLIGEAAREAVSNLISKVKDGMISYPWEGGVIKIDGETVYISGGKKIGLREDDILVVLKEAKRMEDEATGVLLEREFEKLGEIVIIKPEEDYSLCGIIEGKEFKKDYIVQLKDEYDDEQDDTGYEDICTSGKDVDKQREKVDKLSEELNKEIYEKPIGQIRLSNGGSYLLPYREITPKAQEIFNKFNTESIILEKLAPNDAYVFCNRAWVYVAVNSYDKAISMMEKAIALAPKDIRLREQITYLYMDLVRKYDPTSEYNTSTIEGSDILNAIYCRNENYVEANLRAKEIREKYGITDADIERWRWDYIRNAETYLQLGGTEITPENRRIAIEFILLLSNINVWKNYDKCIVVLSNMIKYVEDNPLMWNSLGTAYGVKSLCEKKKECMDKAEECVKKAVELKPESDWFHEHLAIIYSLKGGYYTNGTGVSTVYLLNNDEIGLGYEPKFLYPNIVEREKYKQLAEEEILVKDMLRKKKDLDYLEDTKNNFPEVYKTYTPEQLVWYEQTRTELEELKKRYPDISAKYFNKD